MVLELSDSGRVVNGDREGSSNHKEHHGVLRNRAVKRREKSGARAMATGSSDDGDDLDMEMHLDVAVNGARKRELTFQDMYEDQNLFDDDNEDDDSDWEPVEKFVDFQQWFCTNCTMLNLENLEHCNMCGEHKNSGILKLGFLASQFSQYVGTDNSTEEKKQRRKDAKSSKASSSNSSTVVGFDERMLLHDEVEIKSHPHPERPDRLRAIAAGLAAVGLFPGKCYPITAREITKEELLTVHSLEHVQTVDVTGLIFASYFTPDTYANEHSAQAARLAAGLCADLASEIFCGRAKNGFALIRPPGHHAGVKHAMGFCLHNNAAVAALAAQAAGAKKVLIVDWDVHHGNGTQEIFEQNKSVLYISLHRHEGGKFYPGTGATIEVGSGGAEGYCVNIPWSCGGVGDNDYIFAFQNIVLPIASNFAPDFTIISAGFDAARGDPLGGCDVTPTGYALMTELLYNLCDGRLLVILEGGYNLRSISSSAAEVVKVLLGERPSSESCNTVPSRAGLETVLDVLKFQKNFWPSLQSRIATLESQLSAQSTKSMSEEHKLCCSQEMRKIRRKHVPVWWKWGGKSLLMYHVLGRRFHLKRKGR